MMKKILTYFLVLFIFQASSQKNNLKIHNVSSGINAYSINDFAIDDNDNIWLATNFGLKKFDGYNFIDYHIPKYSYFEIKKLIYHNDSLYIMYRDGKIILLNLKNNSNLILKKEKILDFFVNSKAVFLLKSNYEIEINYKNKKTANYKLNLNKKIPTNNSHANYNIIIHNNAIYFSIPKMGLYKLINGKITNLSKHPSLVPSGYKESFKVINDKLYFLGLIWPLTIDKKDNIETLFFGKDDKEALFVNEISSINHDLFYIRNNNSLVKKTNNKISLIKTLPNIEMKKVFNVGEQIYITSNKGLYEIFLEKSVIQNTNLENALIVKRKIIEEKDRILFFGNPSIISLEKEKIKKLNKKNKSIYDAIKVDNFYYLATEGQGVLKTDSTFINFEPIDKSLQTIIPAIYHDEENGRLYYGCNEFLHQYDLNTKVIRKFPSLFKGYFTKCIVKDLNTGKIFVGTENGLYNLDLKNNKLKTIIKNKIIGDLLIDKKNNLLWVGDESGIIAYSLKNLKIITAIKFDFLVNPKVATLTMDNFGRIWASTFSGLVVYNYQLNKYIKIQNSKLINWEYNYKSACKLKNGNLIFGGLDGYDIIDPKKISFDDTSQLGKISGYIILEPKRNKYFNYLRDNTIQYNINDIFARVFITLDKKISKQNCTFQYKLDNTNWITLNDKKIDLIGLGKGMHTLKIRGFDEIGKLINFTPVKIIVKEDFFKSNTFIFLLVIILLFLLIAILKIINNKVRMKNEIYEKISMDLHDEVGTILSKTSLLINHGGLSEHEKNIISDNIKMANYGLRAYINNLNEKDNQLIDLYYDCIELLDNTLKIKDLSYNYSFVGNKKKNIQQNVYRDLRLCLFEIINNIIKHSKTNHVEIKFKENNGELNLEILEKNNYIDLKDINYGYGIRNLEKRIKRNNGTINFYSDKIKNNFLIKIKIHL